MHRSITRILAALILAFSTTRLLATECPVLLAAHAHGAQQPLTVRRLYHEVETRLAQSGKIYKALIRRTFQGGGIGRSDVTRAWVDARRDLAREQTTDRVTFGGQQSQAYTFTTIYASGTTYSRGSVIAPGQPTVQTAPVLTCQGAHIAASVILGCPNPVQKWTMSLQPGQDAGRQVLVLLRNGTDSSEDFAGTYTTRIYLDRQTLLPLADVTTGTMNTKNANQAHGRATYLTSLVAPSALPGSFFQPSSIGYRGRADEIRQEMKPVPSGFTVLWLGLDFAGGQGVPALSLQRAVPGEGGKDTFSIELYYAPANKVFGTPLLFIEEGSSSSASRQPQPPTGTGYTRKTVKLANGHAVIVSGRATMAFAYIGSTIALIESPGWELSSVRAMETAVRALQPYVPNP